MKINLAIDCLEASAFDTIVTLHSFLNKNEWFDGKIYIIVTRKSLLSNKAISDLLSIYNDIEIIDCSLDPNLVDLIRIHSSNLNSIQKILTIKSLLLPIQKLLFISSSCLFFKNIGPILTQYQLTIPTNLLGEAKTEIFYRRDIINIKKIRFKNINQFIEEKESVLSVFPQAYPNNLCSVIGENSYEFRDTVFIKTKAKLSTLYFIKYDTLRKDIRGSSKINQIWIQQRNLTSTLLKRPSFRGGTSMFSSNSKINPKLDSLVPKQITPVLDESLEKDQVISDVEIDISMSVIIPAHNASLYIEQCLDSIFSQIGDRKIEVLVGVDSCMHTLNTLRSIRAKYSNLKIFYSELSVGAYVMRNSLFEKSKGDAILFFDADDVLMPSAISTLLKMYNPISPIRFKYINFDHGKDLNPTAPVNSDVAHGVFFISSGLFQKIGGFQNWRVGADTEFMKRYAMNKVREIRINSPLFFRRIHNNSLTQNSLTGYKSKLRSQIKNKIKSMRNWSIPVHRHTTKLIEE
jgi:hypothetical protein